MLAGDPEEGEEREPLNQKSKVDGFWEDWANGLANRMMISASQAQPPMKMQFPQYLDIPEIRWTGGLVHDPYPQFGGFVVYDED